MAASRTKNTIRNIGAGLTNRVISIIMPFVNRTAIIWILGAEFAGLSGLFSSILNVLNIAELGFNSAVVYSLYELFARRDEERICELVTLLRRVYRIVGTAVLLLGLIVLPFLPHLVKGDIPDGISIYILYLLYLLNSSLSYFLFAYKECLLIADQRQDIASNIRTAVSVAKYVAQLAVLLITKDFYLYLVVAIIGTAVTNIAIQIATQKKYPKYHALHVRVAMPDKMKQQIKGLVINRVCDTFRNSFDSIIISSLLGLTATAIYGNYYYIYSSLYGIMLVICNAMAASVGNSIVEKSREDNYENMLTFSAAFGWIMGWCTVCLACLYQPFMELWVGKSLLLPERDMLLFCVYFYVINMNNIRNQYISGTGMWWKFRISYIVEALANLILNILLGKLWGITGVILASIITIFLFNYLCRNIILFRNYFVGKHAWKYMAEQLVYAAIAAAAVFVTYRCSLYVQMGTISTMIVRGTICILVPNLIFLFGIWVSPRRKMVFRLLKVVICRKY